MIRKASWKAVLALALMPALAAAGGATLSGTVKIKGRIEKLKTAAKYNPYKAAYNDDKQPLAQTQDLIVYLEGLAPGRSEGGPAVLSQKDRQFSASIVPVLPDGKVEIRNDDTVRHHIRSQAKPWDFNLKPRAPGETVTRSFEAPKDGGIGVVPVYCDIHPNMRSHILIMPTDKWQLLPETGGKYKLTGLPPGTYTLTAWHPTLKPQSVKVTIKKGAKKTVDLVMLGKED